MTAFVIGLVVAVGTAAAPASVTSVTTTTLSPDRLSMVASGVSLIKTYSCSGRQTGSGTGFLIGERIMMTARHVVDPPDGTKACRTKVRVRGRWIGVENWTYWSDRGDPKGRLLDLAVLKLRARVTDAYMFRIRPRPVPVGTNLAAVGHPLGNELSVTQGKVKDRARVRGVPIMLVQLLGAPGVSGAPFLDNNGYVTGVVQQIWAGRDGFFPDLFGNFSSSATVGLDLSSWWGSGKRYLCREYPDGGIPMCGTAAAPKPTPTPKPPPPTPSPTTSTLTDPAGDAGPGAPDIQRLTVTPGTDGRITLRLALGAPLAGAQSAELYFNTGQALNVGSHRLVAHATEYRFERWSGSAFETWFPPSINVGLADQGRTIVMSVAKAELGIGGILRLIVLTSSDDSGTATVDDAPNGASGSPTWWTVPTS